MGKKGSWFSAIKRVFIPSSKEKLVNGAEKKSRKEKKKGLGKLRSGDATSFIPRFREPSSIEKILGDAEREQQKNIIKPPTPSEQRPKTPPSVQLLAQPSLPPRAASPRAASPRAASPRAASPRIASPKVTSPRGVHHHKEISYRPSPTLWNHHVAAIRIQAAYRGYAARRSFRALRGLVRLQEVVRGNNVKRQTMNAMKYMQLLVRVQSQIRSRRIQMLENQALQHHALGKNDKEVESSLSKWTLSQTSEAGNQEEWDDSLLTKEEIEARLQKKVEAVMKRERAMSYAYSHQLWKATPKSAQTSLMDIRSGGFPWWWNWLERQLPPANTPETQPTKNIQMTPSRPNMEHKPSPSPRLHASSNYKQQSFGFDNLESPTPRSSRSPLPTRMKMAQTPSPFNRIPHIQSPSLQRFSKPRTSAADSNFDAPLKDDDSLTSCPPFPVPNYMSPTASARAKARAYPSHKLPSPSDDQKRRLSFPLTPSKWSKGSLFKDSPSHKMLDKHQSAQSVGNLSVDSTTSLPAGLGRKPFNR
ncbi:protein IQ-DOMAIN 13-like isoform X2 [Malania oleifera]|nr:protein IQ-DOMAIN 13-like isoform X2 [Malania oleifera]XP_057957242.1 protein IQ-DOMAIN 13-like isoform X2 [Malania oleifera]